MKTKKFQRKVIKVYSYVDYEENMIRLKKTLGVDTTQEALGQAVRFTSENHISQSELELMAENEKRMGGK